MGYIEPGHEDLASQLDWAAKRLAEYFYSYPSNPIVTFVDGTTVPLATDLNAGTFALIKFLAINATEEQWLLQIGDGPGSFSDIYRSFFGDHLQDVVIERTTLQSMLKLPFGCGEDWIYSNGPHRPPTNPAIDFAPMVSGCGTSTKKVVAAADGIVVYKLDYEVVLDHDMDGNRGTGLTTQYYHLRDVQVNTGDTVYAGDHLGYPSCQGGSATGTHLHFGFGYNGEWVSAVGQVLSGWTINSDGSMTKPGEQTRYPSTYWSGYPNHFISDNCPDIPPPDTTAPDTSITSGPSGCVGTNDVTFHWTGSDDQTPTGNLQYRYRLDGYSGWSGWTSNTSKTYNNLPDGSYIFRVKARDAARNEDPTPATRSFQVNAHAPPPPTSAQSNCEAQNNLWQNVCNQPQFTWSAPSGMGCAGIAQYEYRWETESGTLIESDTAGDASFTPQDPVGGGVYKLRLRAQDTFGRWSGWTDAFILRYDSTVPTVTVQINGGAETINQTSVLLSLNADDNLSGVTEVCVSNNSFCTDWQPYADTILWNLPALNRRTLPVYVQVRDHAGNESTVASDSIYLDLYPPMPHSANYRICADVVDAGGSVGITSTNYSLVSAIGQPWAGGGETGVFRKKPGFWCV